jgi:hypothetical protein
MKLFTVVIFLMFIGFSSLVQCLRVRLEATQAWFTSKVLHMGRLRPYAQTFH